MYHRYKIIGFPQAEIFFEQTRYKLIEKRQHSGKESVYITMYAFLFSYMLIEQIQTVKTIIEPSLEIVKKKS